MGDKERDHSCAPNYERDHEQAQKLRIFLYENYPTDEDHEESEYAISIITTLTTRLALADKERDEAIENLKTGCAGENCCPVMDEVTDLLTRLAAVEKERDEANQAYHDLANEAQQKYAKYQANLNEARVVVEDREITLSQLHTLLMDSSTSDEEKWEAMNAVFLALAAMEEDKCGKCGDDRLIHICEECEQEECRCVVTKPVSCPDCEVNDDL